MFVISKVKIGSDEQYKDFQYRPNRDYQYSEKEDRAQQRQSQEQRDKCGTEVSSEAMQLDFKFHHFPKRNLIVSVITETIRFRFGCITTTTVGPTLEISKTIFSSS